ncbi:MAG: hypothetical protein Q9227_006486 [Pyrenula ochraceoflavens]
MTSTVSIVVTMVVLAVVCTLIMLTSQIWDCVDACIECIRKRVMRNQKRQVDEEQGGAGPQSPTTSFTRSSEQPKADELTASSTNLVRGSWKNLLSSNSGKTGVYHAGEPDAGPTPASGPTEPSMESSEADFGTLTCMSQMELASKTSKTSKASNAHFSKFRRK